MSLGMILLAFVTLGGTIFALLSKRFVGIPDDTINEEYLKAMRAKQAVAQQQADLAHESQKGVESLKERMAIFQQNSRDGRRQAQRDFIALKEQMTALQRRDQHLASQVGILADGMRRVASKTPQSFEAIATKGASDGPGKSKSRGGRGLMRR